MDQSIGTNGVQFGAQRRISRLMQARSAPRSAIIWDNQRRQSQARPCLPRKRQGAQQDRARGIRQL